MEAVGLTEVTELHLENWVKRILVVFLSLTSKRNGTISLPPVPGPLRMKSFRSFSSFRSCAFEPLLNFANLDIFTDNLSETLLPRFINLLSR